MDESKRSQGTLFPMMEPPRYLKLGIDAEAIMRRNKVTMFAETSKCELAKIEKRRRPTVQLPKLFSLSKTAIPFMHSRKLHKSQNLSTISLYHQMDRDIRSVSKEDINQSHQSIISHLPSNTSLLRLGIPYTIERSRRKSKAIMSQRHVQNISSGVKLKKPKKQLGRRDMFVCPEYDPEKRQKVREEILGLIAAKEKKDKGIKDDVVKLPDGEAEEEEEEEEIGSPPNLNDEKVLSGYERYLERQKKSRAESADKEKSPSIKTQFKDNDSLKKSSIKDDLSLREMKNINKAFGLGSPIHRLVSLAAKEDIENKNPKHSLERTGFSKFLEENVARKNRRAKTRRDKRYNPSTISLYHYILQDLQVESENEFTRVLGSFSELSLSDIPRVNSSLGLINKLSLMSSASLMSMDWKWMIPGEEMKPKERPPLRKSESVKLVPTTMYNKCAAKKAVSDECTRMIKEGTCGGENEGDYGQQMARQGESKHSWSPPPSSKFTAELEKWTKERGLKTLLCEIMGALRKSKTTNEARFIAEFLDSKLDQIALRERLSQNDEGKFNYTSAEKVKYCTADSEEATWTIYESLKKRFCRRIKEEGSQSNINADIDDRSICSSETSHKDDDDDNDEDICDACFLPSDPVMLSAYEGRTPYEIYRKERKKKIKCSWPPDELCLPTGEIDLGERDVDPSNDIAFLSRLLKMKGLTFRTVCDKKEDGGDEEEEEDEEEHFEEDDVLRRILEEQEPSCVQCEWWERIIVQGKRHYDKYMEGKDSRAWVCHHYSKQRYSLLPYRKPPKDMSEEMKKAIQFVHDLCIRKREASELFDCRMRRENYKSLAMTLLKEKRKGLDIPQPPSALIPDRPSDFPEEGYRKLLEEERLLREKLKQGKKKFSDTMKKLDMKMDEIICPKDCASWPEDLTVTEDLLLAEKKAEPKDELIQNYIKLVKEFRLWNMSELIFTRFINSILHKIYPHQQLVNNYTYFNLSRGVDYFNSLLVVEALTNESLYEFIDTFEEFEYVRILTRICQECPRLPSMHGWAPEAVMFDLNEYGIDKLPALPTDPTIPLEEEIKASNWTDFFTLTKRTTMPSDYGRYKPYLHNLEDPDEPSEQDESLNPLKSNKLKDLWQDLPAMVSFLDLPGGKIEPRPSDKIVRNKSSGKSSGSQKLSTLSSEEDPLKIKKIEEVKEFISSHPPNALEFNNMFRMDEHAEQRKSILVILAEVIETETETLSRINSMGPDNENDGNDDDDDNDEDRERKKKKKPKKTLSTGITVVPATQDEEEEKRMSRFHDGMEKMFRSLNNSRYPHLDGMDERLEVMDAPEQRDVAKSRPSVILDEPPKLAKRLLSIAPKILTLEDLKATDIETLDEEDEEEEEPKEESKDEESKEEESKPGKVFEKNVPITIDKDYFATSESAMARKIFLKQNPLKTKVSSKLSHDATNVDSKVRILPSRHSQLGLSSDRFSQSEIAKLAAGKNKDQDKDKGKRKVTILDKDEEEGKKT